MKIETAKLWKLAMHESLYAHGIASELSVF